ncbi:efflux RND transporter periplasmic adaptor subunit [Sphingobium sufflavum]|uniref:efflux RND transporter periplasmic adaptor subunit n=1 Tax=Sphingobium sufflavum TaxID=1129547 RepID=UPI001F39D6BB|nr:efflux RND transporter periplasmic adaptor subunit [Sphingobium sufflavum]MCE7795834.1 efflux RND transporter periplasmic adaptor subunit [Sphingobium sufflavum]
MNYEPKLAGDLQSAGRDGDDEDRVRARRRIFRTAGIGVAVILVLALWVVWTKTHNGADGANDGPEIPSVTVIAATSGAVGRSASGTGALAARRDMPVSVVGEGGRVLAVQVEPGSWVRAGQTLATIERSVQTQQTASLAAQVDVARADAKLAEANLTRARALVGNGFISKADLETRIANRDAAAARVNVAIAQLNQARASMARLDVRAPADGLVLTRTVEAGQVVSGGSGVLFRIALKGEMEMQLALNEGDIVGIKVGDRASVVPVGATAPVIGTVWQISPVVDPQTRQGVVRILLPYDRSLRPGAFAQASVAISSVPGVLLPESAVQSDEKGNFVYVVDGHNLVVRRPVETGTVSDAGVSVVKGLSGGERVIATAGGFLSAGDKVKPVRASAP